MEAGICYVVVSPEGALEGTVVLDFSGEPAYDRLTEGAWLTAGEYAALHRVAVDPACKGRGIGGEMVAFAESRCRDAGVESLRCDTHELNAAMRRMMEKNGFVPCGRLRYPVAGERLAYEKVLD